MSLGEYLLTKLGYVSKDILEQRDKIDKEFANRLLKNLVEFCNERSIDVKEILKENNLFETVYTDNGQLPLFTEPEFAPSQIIRSEEEQVVQPIVKMINWRQVKTEVSEQKPQPVPKVNAPVLAEPVDSYDGLTVGDKVVENTESQIETIIYELVEIHPHRAFPFIVETPLGSIKEFAKGKIRRSSGKKSIVLETIDPERVRPNISKDNLEEDDEI